jgi:hypothetical protein
MAAKSGAVSPRKSTTLPTLEKVIGKIYLDDKLCFWQGVRKIFRPIGVNPTYYRHSVSRFAGGSSDIGVAK